MFLRFSVLSLFCFLSGLDFQTKMDVEMDEPEPVAQNNEKVKLNLYGQLFVWYPNWRTLPTCSLSDFAELFHFEP